jgi:hypothetical protein
LISLDLPMSVWEDLLAQAAMGRALGGRRDDLAPRPLAWLTKNASITLVPAASLKPPSHPPERSFGHRPLDRLWLTKRPDCGTATGDRRLPAAAALMVFASGWLCGETSSRIEAVPSSEFCR